MNRCFDFLKFNIKKLHDWLGSVAHLEFKQDLKAEEETLDLDKLFNLVEVLKNELQVKQRVAILLGLIAHGCNVVNQNAIDVRWLLGLTGMQGRWIG